ARAQQDGYVFEIIGEAFKGILQQFQDAALQIYATRFGSDAERNDAYKSTFNGVLDSDLANFIRWDHLGYDDVSLKQATLWLKHHNKAYKAAYNQYFSGLPLTQVENRKIKKLAAYALKSTRPTESMTGLVFAGFGDEELFP